MDKILWKSGEMQLDDIRMEPFEGEGKEKHHFRVVDKEIREVRKHMHDLMMDVDSLLAIDDPNMLALNVTCHYMEDF